MIIFKELVSFSAIARSVMISASALQADAGLKRARFSAIARSVMISAPNGPTALPSLERFSAIARSVMISA